ncbi:MAG: CAP domain-containing protein [Candidatus Gracilibacteria bacterium]|nr:CAP domain-containing protein [Candidatus Gracilibacteria bacterium]
MLRTRSSTFILICLSFLLSLLFDIKLVQADVSYPSIQSSKFPGISLENDLPKQFIVNEHYLVRGSLSNSNLKSLNVLLQDEEGQILSQETFSVNAGLFEFTLAFHETGKFMLNLSPGTLRSSARAQIRVLPRAMKVDETVAKHTPPSNLRTFMEGNQSYFEWKNRGTDNLNRLTFKQGAKSLVIYTSNGASSWEANYALFREFDSGEATWTIESAYSGDGSLLGRKTDWSRSASKKILIGEHHFAQISSLLTLKKLDFQNHRNGVLNLSGSCLAEIDATARVITPSGKIEEFSLKDEADFLLSKEEFSFSYIFREEGSYFLELVNRNHLPVLNIPVYVGKSLALLPDPIDLAVSTENQLENLQLMNVKMLNFINKERRAYKLNELSLDDELNKLAASYAQEVASSGNFSHISLTGENANQRRVNFGILTPVGENLAQAGSIEEAHYLLMRSATHRANILDPRWERAGIGLALNQAGFLIIVQEFSVRSVKKDPLSAGQVQALTREVTNSINKKRSKQGLEELSTDYALQNTLAEALSFSKGDSELTLLRLAKSEVFTRIKQRILSLSATSHYADLGKLFSEHERVTDTAFHKIAVAIYQDETEDNLSTVILLER